MTMDREKALQALENIKAQALEGVRFSDTKIFDFVESNYEVVRSALTAPDAVDVAISDILEIIVASMKRVDECEGEGGGSFLDYARGIYADLEVRGLLRTADDGWLPIETAPKDGTEVLLFDAEYDPKITSDWWHSYSNGDGHWENAEVMSDYNPTHWRHMDYPKAEVKK